MTLSASPSETILRLQQGPIVTTLLRLALPNVLAMVMTVLVGIAETYYVGRLGTTPLAAMALVFPFAMLTGMMSAGAMGGGVSSAISRALGAHDTVRANTLAYHALVIGTVAGIVYSLVFVLFGTTFYAVLGGSGAVLGEATRYSIVLFSGALLVWLSNTLGAILRGTGNMRVPSIAIAITALLQICLGGVLALGLGPLPSLGMVGIAIGHIVATTLGVVFLTWFLLSGRSRLTLQLRGVRLRRDLFGDILKVGALALISPLQSVLAVVIFTGFVARLGVLPLAGYSIGQRLEFLLIPIAFGIGVAAVPMVGMAIGAGDVARARRVAWSAGALSAFNLSIIGLTVTVMPDLWATLFSSDQAVLDYARQYLRLVGPVFPLFGLGLTLYFAAQGSGKLLGPVLAGTVRLIVVVTGGMWLARQGFGAVAYFGLVAAAMASYGIATAAAVKFAAWGASTPAMPPR
ncbi:MAG: MATE family efflux transporter [Gammaproteobacteria bacterium]|jgi:putative MATE family efflux protein|nr:MATE family efflux transporter [Gammaproteobacteria bacterium]